MGGRIKGPLSLQRAFTKVDRSAWVDWGRLLESSSAENWSEYSAGDAGLEQMLGACEDPRLFMSTVLFSYLLGPRKAPEAVRSWLVKKNVCSGLNCPLSLEVLEAARWRRVAVPLAAESERDLKWMLVGAGQELCAFPGGRSVFAQSSVEAIALVEKLVAGKWGCSFAVWPMHPGCGAPTVSGPSLGLPLFLGAAAAHLKLSSEEILATGALSPGGEVLPVGYVREKLACIPPEAAIFIHPAGVQHGECPVSGPGPVCVPVNTVEQAVSVLRCNGPELAPGVVAAQTSLDTGKNMARSLCSLCTGMDAWVEQNRERIGRALQSDDEIGELIGQIVTWCHSTTGNDRGLGSALLDCLDVSAGTAVAEKGARIGWNLALLQMDRANHRGDIETCSAWKKLAERLHPEVMRTSDDGEREHLVYYVRTTIDDCHNRYRFEPGLPDSLLEGMSLGQSLRAMENAFEDRRCRYGACQDSALGRYYGTMGQHYLFCGPQFHDRGMAFLDQAMVAFGSGEVNGCLDEWKRDRFYSAFGLLEAGRFQEAEEILSGLCGKSDTEEWPVRKMTPFWLHALLRMYVDSGIELPLSLLHELASPISGRSDHPGQLLAYNYARLHPNPQDRLEWYECSLRRCLSEQAGPTIRAMALLPLSRMHLEGMHMPDMAEKCEQVRDVLENSGLDAEHFRCVRDAGSWQEMLKTVVRREKELFPYMYR